MDPGGACDGPPDTNNSVTVCGGALDPLTYLQLSYANSNRTILDQWYTSAIIAVTGAIAAKIEDTYRTMPGVSNVQARVNTVLAGSRALQALQNPDCAALFEREDHVPDPATVLSDILNGTSAFTSIQYSYIGATNVHAAPNATGGFGVTFDLINATTDPTGTVITLNTNLLSSIGSGNAVAGATTLLHELGHVYGFLFGATSTDIQNDAGNPDLSKANAARITEACFK